MKDSTSNRIAGVVTKLTKLAENLREGNDYPITRLTVLKKVCQDPQLAAHFGLHLGRLAHKKAGEPYQPLIKRALSELEQRLKRRPGKVPAHIFDVFHELQASQNEYRRTRWGDVRTVHSREALIAEYALRCVTHPSRSAYWAYMLARHHAERYDPRYGNGLIPASAPAVEDILAFWSRQLRSKS